jgi:hypothetical protein
MKFFTIFRLLSRGFHDADPKFEDEAKRLEDEEYKRNQNKENACREFKRVMHLSDDYAISRWRREEGRAIDLGSFSELEIWQRGDHFRLAVKKENWEVYIIIPNMTGYDLRRKIL